MKDSEMTTQEDVNEIKLQVGLLEKDVRMADRQCEKVSIRVGESITKLQEVNSNLVKMITIHEHKHDQHIKIEEEMKEDIKELHSRITSVNKEMQEKMTHLEHHISEKVDSLRMDLISKNEPTEKKNFLSTIIDQYKWMIIGASLIIGWIFGNIGGVIKFLSIFE